LIEDQPEPWYGVERFVEANDGIAAAVVEAS
jgi:hypothetical protein